MHPDLLEEEQVECSVLRAVARCLRKRFGGISTILDGTMSLTRQDKIRTWGVMVYFEYMQRVRCQLSWVWHPNGTGILQNEGDKKAEPSILSSCGVDLSLLKTFYLIGFYLELKEGSQLYLEGYVTVKDSEGFTTRFVKKLFEDPPIKAVKMMAQSLQRYHYKNDVCKLQGEIQHLVGICGGLRCNEKTSDDFNIVFVKQKIVSLENIGAENRTNLVSIQSFGHDILKTGNLCQLSRSIEVLYQVNGRTQDLEVLVRFTLYNLCYVVMQYKVSVKTIRIIENII